VDAELGEDLAKVVLGGAGADEKAGADFGVGQAFAGQLRNVQLLAGQRGGGAVRRDGEDIPVEFFNQIIARIVDSVDVPVTADSEGGYTDDDDQLAQNLSGLLDIGIVGINFEDRVVKGSGLYSIDRQASRIAVLRRIADQKGLPLFVNARTDLFLGQGNDPQAVVGEALDRAAAYSDAGASGFFIPGLQEKPLITRISEGAALPVNVMVMDGVPSNVELAEIGIARISYGATPYVDVLSALEQNYRKVQ
jgi:2-methylisocitrate lyase-like PEP mutase family enzyme